MIRYYEDDLCSKEKGSIEMKDVLSINEADPSQCNGKPNGLLLRVEGAKPYVLHVFADSENDKDMWLNDLNAVIKQR